MTRAWIGALGIVGALAAGGCDGGAAVDGGPRPGDAGGLDGGTDGGLDGGTDARDGGLDAGAPDGGGPDAGPFDVMLDDILDGPSQITVGDGLVACVRVSLLHLDGTSDPVPLSALSLVGGVGAELGQEGDCRTAGQIPVIGLATGVHVLRFRVGDLLAPVRVTVVDATLELSTGGSTTFGTSEVAYLRVSERVTDAGGAPLPAGGPVWRWIDATVDDPSVLTVTSVGSESYPIRLDTGASPGSTTLTYTYRHPATAFTAAPVLVQVADGGTVQRTQIQFFDPATGAPLRTNLPPNELGECRSARILAQLGTGAAAYHRVVTGTWSLVGMSYDPVTERLCITGPGDVSAAACYFGICSAAITRWIPRGEVTAARVVVHGSTARETTFEPYQVCPNASFFVDYADGTSEDVTGSDYVAVGIGDGSMFLSTALYSPDGLTAVRIGGHRCFGLMGFGSGLMFPLFTEVWINAGEIGRASITIDP